MSGKIITHQGSNQEIGTLSKRIKVITTIKTITLIILVIEIGEGIWMVIKGEKMAIRIRVVFMFHLGIVKLV